MPVLITVISCIWDSSQTYERKTIKTKMDISVWMTQWLSLLFYYSQPLFSSCIVPWYIRLSFGYNVCFHLSWMLFSAAWLYRHQVKKKRCRQDKEHRSCSFGGRYPTAFVPFYISQVKASQHCLKIQALNGRSSKTDNRNICCWDDSCIFSWFELWVDCPDDGHTGALLSWVCEMSSQG